MTNWHDHDGPGQPPPARRMLRAALLLVAIAVLAFAAGAILFLK